jgi:hypothetical protein
MNAVTRFLVAFGRFWYEFIIGDDWKIAVAVVLGLVVTGGLMALAIAGGLPLGPVAVIGALVILGLFVAALAIDVRLKRR